MVKRLLPLLTSLLLAVAAAIGQDVGMDTRTGVFNPAFRTLLVSAGAGEDPFAPPVVVMGDPASYITVSFDELAEDRRYMRAEVVKCDERWQPEQVVDSEYLDGFNEMPVDDYYFSRATLVHYVHYTVRIPSEQMRITQPGNYLLRVFDEDDRDVTLLQARFYVCDFSAFVSASLTDRTDIDARASHQQLSFAVDTRHVDGISDPYTELTVVVLQNGRLDNAVTLTAPQRVAGHQVFYEHLRPLIFKAGNEYRRFETVSTAFPGIGVETIDYVDPVYHHVLTADTPRAGLPYNYDFPTHGHSVVRAEGVADSDTEADYTTVHLSLEMPELADADIFVDSDFTHRRFDPASRMVYDRATSRYELPVLLKQGAYSYQYLVVSADGSLQGSTGPVEGDKYETHNEYTVFVYHRPRMSRMSRMSRLIGVTRLEP